MDFGLGDNARSLREQVRAFLDRHLTDEVVERCRRTGVSHDTAFVKAMHDADLLALGFGEEWGGRPCDPLDLCVVQEEMSKVEAPTYGVSTTQMVVRAILRSGTDRQRTDIVRAALAGDILIALGFTEPECGSDLAAARTRAIRDGDAWIVNGSKMFTTNAHIADYVFLLTRTDPGGRHAGLTLFLVPLDLAGITFQEVRAISGERTNITFYEDVRIDDRWRVGEVNGGWRILGEALQEEHSVGFGASLQRLLEATESWVRDRPDRLDDGVRERLGRCAADTEVSLLLQRRAAMLAAAHQDTAVEGPMAKLFSSEAMTRSAEHAFDMVGPDAVRSLGTPGAPADGQAEYGMRFSLGTTIYGGTSEIQRSLIARGLGLPR